MHLLGLDAQAGLEEPGEDGVDIADVVLELLGVSLDHDVINVRECERRR